MGQAEREARWSRARFHAFKLRWRRHVHAGLTDSARDMPNFGIAVPTVQNSVRCGTCAVALRIRASLFGFGTGIRVHAVPSKNIVKPCPVAGLRPTASTPVRLRAEMPEMTVDGSVDGPGCDVQFVPSKNSTAVAPPHAPAAKT